MRLAATPSVARGVRAQVADLPGRGEREARLRGQSLDPLTRPEPGQLGPESRVLALDGGRAVGCAGDLAVHPQQVDVEEDDPRQQDEDEPDPDPPLQERVEHGGAPSARDRRGDPRPPLAGRAPCGRGCARRRAASGCAASGKGGHQAPAPSMRRAARSLPELERGLSATSPGVGHHGAAGQQLGLGRPPARADGKVGRADAAPRALGQEALDPAVLERVERDRGDAPARAQDRPRARECTVEVLQLMVDRDPNGLKDALGGRAPAELPPHGRRQRRFDRCHQLARGLERRALAAAHDLARDRARVGLLAEGRQHLGQLPLVHRVHQLAGVRARGGIHPHVERRVVGVGESALAGVDLHRRDAEVEAARGRPRAPPRPAAPGRPRSPCAGSGSRRPPPPPAPRRGSSAAGSRSTQTSVPPGPMRSATSRA